MTDPLDLLRQHLGDRYELERELGGGGMSRVYLAEERALGRKVVIKVLAPELGQRVNADRFQQEIATSAMLQHPQIVPVYQAGAVEDRRFYVMPFIAGESLRARLDRERRLAPAEVIRLLSPLARALAYAHRQGIVHRDVKPENVLLSEGEPMLADFGIAKVIREGNNGTGLTSAGMSIGTVTYMSPEQVVADPSIDGKADVYSLAAVGYELLAGEPPYVGSPQQVMSAHVVQPAPPLAARCPDAPAGLVEAIHAGLEKDVSRRPDAEHFATMLEQARHASGTGTMRTTSTHPGRTDGMATGAGEAGPGPRAGIARVVGAVATVVTLAVAGWLWSQRTSAGLVAVAHAEPTIAVLPFESIGASENAYLSAGIADEVMTGLAQVRGLRVLSRATTRAYADSGFSPMAYGERLGVRALVEGSVQSAGDQLRIRTRLVDTRDGSAMWSDGYDRPMSDLFTTQREISNAVIGALTPRLGLSAVTPGAERHKADPQAYDLFLRGRVAMLERGEGSLRNAITLFRDAAERDPQFARAHAGVAEAAALMPLYSAVTHAQMADTIRRAAGRALALDSALAAPHVALGMLEKGLRRWNEGEEALAAAIRLAPNEGTAHQNLGELQYTLGRFDDSRRSLERAATLEPTDATIVSEFAWSLLLTGQLDSASRVVGRAAAAAARNPYVSFTQAMVAERRGDLRAALRHMQAVVDAAPLPFFRGALSRAQHLAGDTAAARTTRDALAALESAPGATFARVIAGLPIDAPATLLTGLEAALREGDPFVVLLPLRVWWYDRVRSDARFTALATSMGMPSESVRPMP